MGDFNLFEAMAGEQKWYHATQHDLPIGTTLTPGGGTTEYENFYDRRDDEGRSGHVWIDSLKNVKSKWSDPTTHYIYEVTPSEPPQQFKRQIGQMMVAGDDGWTVPSAQITRVIRRPQAPPNRL